MLPSESINRPLAFGVSLLPVALAGGLFLSWIAGIGVIALKYAGGPVSAWLGGAMLYVAMTGALAWGIGRFSAAVEPKLVGALIALSAGVKLLLVFGFHGLPLNTDQAIFHHFVREMADSHLAGETLCQLSQIYDYPVWAGRALPIHYVLRRWLGEQDLLWVRMLNVVLSTALLAATYGFACRLLPRGRRKWAVFLMLALPFQWFVVTDYSHHLFSSFYFLICLWCGWELVFTSPSRWRVLGLSGVIGICLMLMMWQRGMHLIALGAFGVLLVWVGLAGWGRKCWGKLFLSLAVFPLLLAVPVSHSFDRWLEHHDVGQLNSVLPAFVARGWCPESGGEYCGRYEQLDRVTPAPKKADAMFRLVLSQIRHNPRAVCWRLPVVKTSKLFLVGYASNFEESLVMENSALLPWVRGMRLAAVPVFLGLALWGCLVLARSPALQVSWLPVLLALLLTWGAYVVLGETSPRYSIFCQPFLALLGALAIGGADAVGSRLSRAVWRELVLRAALVLALLTAALGGIALAVWCIPVHRLYANLERGWAVAGAPQSGALRPFEARMSLEQATWRLPPRSEESNVLSFYLLEAQDAARLGRIVIRADETVLFDRSATEVRWPLFVELELPATATELVFEGTGGGGGSWLLGYVTFRGRDGVP